MAIAQVLAQSDETPVQVGWIQFNDENEPTTNSTSNFTVLVGTSTANKLMYKTLVAGAGIKIEMSGANIVISDTFT